MRWKGIALGIAIGGALRGPLGAFVGALLGDYVGKRISPRLAGKAAGRLKAKLQSKKKSRHNALQAVCMMAADYAVLGLSPNASMDEVQRAYRNLAKSHHPDLLRAQGRPEKEIAAAAEYMSKINAAYSRIKTT
jgi:DnaJ-domain-containing protein 1